MDRNDKKYTFFESYHRALLRVSDERYGRIVRAMSEYTFNQAEPSFTDDGDWIVWELIKPILQKGMNLSDVRREANSKRRNKKNQHSSNKLQQSATKKAFVAEVVQQSATDKEEEKDKEEGIIKDTNVSMSSFDDVLSGDDINYQNLLLYFNSIMRDKAIPAIERMTIKRRNAVKARITEFGKEAAKIVIDNAANSTFLNGGGDNGFVASFDWLFKPNNFPKVLEGNYVNKSRKQTYNGSGSTTAERLDGAASLIAQLRAEGKESED